MKKTIPSPVCTFLIDDTALSKWILNVPTGENNKFDTRNNAFRVSQLRNPAAGLLNANVVNRFMAAA